MRHENGVGNLNASKGHQGNGVGGLWGGAETPLVLQGLAGVGSLKAREVEGYLTGICPEGWYSHPAAMMAGT